MIPPFVNDPPDPDSYVMNGYALAEAEMKLRGKQKSEIGRQKSDGK